MAKEGGSIMSWIFRAAVLGVLVLIAVAVWSSAPEDRIVHDDEANEEGVFVEIPVEGIIADSAEYGVNPVSWVDSCLDRASRELRLKGILLRVNSPGGGIRASDEILASLREFKAKQRVPVVVWMKDVAASGGYYVAMSGDWIVAHENTITGSIGVIWPTMKWSKLMTEIGIELGNLKSAPMKDILSPNRDMSDEERELIQKIVDDAYSKFVRLVVGGRKGKGQTVVTEAVVRGLESRIVSGTMALESGLVDELGSRTEALAKLKELAEIERADVIEYAKPKPFIEELLLGSRVPNPIEQRLARLSYLYAEGPALLALWER